jgi:hypothetical protein
VEELVADPGQLILDADDEEDDSSTLDTRKLLPFALQATFRQNAKPKRLKVRPRSFDCRSRSGLPLTVFDVFLP